MPHYFLSEEAAQDLQNIIRTQIEDLEQQLGMKKAIWNDLGNKYLCPEQIETDYNVVEDEDINEHRIQGNFEVIDNTHSRPHIALEENEEEPAQKEVALTQADLIIPKYLHDTRLEKPYKTLFYYEDPDGRVVLRYMGSLTFTTKEKILQLPFPFPIGYFKNAGLKTANSATAIRLYREFLFISQNEKRLSEKTAKPEEPRVSEYVNKSSRDRILEDREQKHKQEIEIKSKEPVISKEDIAKKYSKMLDVDEKDEDWKYKSLGLNNTRVGKEDYDKVEGGLE